LKIVEKSIFQQTFNLFDNDGDGMIGKEELLRMLKALGNNVTLIDVDEIMKEIGTAKKGFISFEEFCYIMKTPSIDTNRVLPTRRKSVVPTSHLHPVDSQFIYTPSKIFTGRRHSATYETALAEEQTQFTLQPSKKVASSGFSFKNLFKKKSPISQETHARTLPPESVSSSLTVTDTSDQVSMDDMRGVFQLFDTNSDGFISVGEFRTISARLGIGVIMEESEVRQLFDLVDLDRDGRISFDEFVKLFNIS